MDHVEQIERLIGPSLDGLGYDLVRVQLGGDRNLTLQIMAERKDRDEMTVENCAEISRNVSAILDVEDPIKSAYTLEVSSPGIDRPLVRPEDYSRYVGYEARIELRDTVAGRKRFKGRLAGLRGDAVVIEGETEESEIPFSDIARGKLLLTDELIAAAMKNQNR